MKKLLLLTFSLLLTLQSSPIRKLTWNYKLEDLTPGLSFNVYSSNVMPAQWLLITNVPSIQDITNYYILIDTSSQTQQFYTVRALDINELESR